MSSYIFFSFNFPVLIKLALFLVHFSSKYLNLNFGFKTVDTI